MMDGFNYAFSLLDVLLGLSLAQVLSGFAMALRQRTVIRLGWLTPLLAIFVMLDLVSFWEWIWAGRKFLQPSYGILCIGLLVSGMYFVATSMVFPRQFDDKADCEENYFKHRRQIFSLIFLSNLFTTVPVLIFRAGQVPLHTWVESGTYFAGLLIAFATPAKRINIAVLSILILLYLYAAVMSFIEPLAL